MYPVRGFTLVELLIVTALIIILSVIGTLIFFNATAKARDSVRMAELVSLAKSIEVTKDRLSGIYSYSLAQFNNDYQIKPADPLRNPSASFYCVSISSTGVPEGPFSWSSGQNCPLEPAGFTTLIDSSTNYQGEDILNGVKYWKVCARLEVSGSPFCAASGQP